jgi:hypothetical protein
MTEPMVDDALIRAVSRGIRQCMSDSIRDKTGIDDVILAKAAIAIAYPAGVAAGREEARTEIVRLRGLLIDPGDPAWEDARAVLVAELRKADLPDHAAQVADGQGAYVPSWIVLNLIAHAATAIRQRGE